MELSRLKKDQKAIIKKINSTTELKQRFYSFGITKGAHIEVENVSLARNTIEINIENTSIGLRVEEAKAIEVEVI
ncbi:MAG: FeoA family protein [Campylobacterota bacterium]|nr:FeoA family protein [Campylobacterota bacterium]